jgi:hypothetical protein
MAWSRSSARRGTSRAVSHSDGMSASGSPRHSDSPARSRCEASSQAPLLADALAPASSASNRARSSSSAATWNW